jgi:hypothetical protein
MARTGLCIQKYMQIILEVRYYLEEAFLLQATGKQLFWVQRMVEVTYST